MQEDEEWEDEEEDMCTGGGMKNLLGSVFAPASDFPGKSVRIYECTKYTNKNTVSEAYIKYRPNQIQNGDIDIPIP